MKNCSLCSKELKFANTPLFGAGNLKDEGVLCTRCFRRVTKKMNIVKCNKYTLDDIKELLEFEEKEKSVSKTPTTEKNKTELNNLKKNWEPCPRCGSNKVKKHSFLQNTLSATFGGLAFAGCGIWLLIIPILGILMIVLGGLTTLYGVIMLMLIGFTGKNIRQLTCSDCKLTWEYGRYDTSNT